MVVMVVLALVESLYFNAKSTVLVVVAVAVNDGDGGGGGGSKW